jgi:hypothetical protein
VFIVDKSEPDYCIRTKSDLQANLQGKEGSAVSSRGAAGADEIKERKISRAFSWDLG